MLPRRFIETDETYRFFKRNVLLGTNEIHSNDVSSSSDSDSNESYRLQRVRRRRRTSSVLSRRASRRLTHLLSGIKSESLKDDEILRDREEEEEVEEDYESLDDFELEEEEERQDLGDKRDIEVPNGTVTAGMKMPRVGTVKYEQVFDPFVDLYVRPTCGKEEKDENGKRKSRQQTQFYKARRAITAFTRRVHCANGYRYRKQSEFMRVCYQRALENEPGFKLLEPVKVETCGNSIDDGDGNGITKQVLLTTMQKEDAVETTVPHLFPRKWPQLPFRSPLQWYNDTDAAIAFLSQLAEVPETRLMYEPIDTDRFAAEVTELLQLSKNEATGSSAMSESAFTGLVGLFAMGVQLQSSTLVSRAALQFIRVGQSTYLGSEFIRPELRKLLDFYRTRMAKYVHSPTLAATFPRGLSAQWKICSYQPSTSDAIATDGLYLYMFGRSGLYKIGTGNGTTVRDYIYAHNKEYVRSRNAERSWLCYIGGALYCRTILMPGHRVDRIRTSDLENVQELVLAPNHALIGKGTTERGVYAIVTDGIDLFTIRCIDTFTKPSPDKSSNSRKPRSRSQKSRNANPVSGLASAVHGKGDSGLTSPPHLPDSTSIQVGDRVVRGPHWKWSDQDGGKGSLGTAERISTWGGVKGSGVTVRWDMNQRVNTYRWGAEGCYDLYIVTEKDGQVVEQKPLPNHDCSKQTKDRGIETINHVNEPDPLPRHQLVLYRHRVNEITTIMRLEKADIDLFLDLTPSGDQRKKSSNGSTDGQSGLACLSTLHSHSVALCTSKTSWMCDGRMSSCFGDKYGKRYRCTFGCDYDLCESCLFDTLTDTTSCKSTADDAVVEDGDVSSDGKKLTDDRLDIADDTIAKSEREVLMKKREEKGKHKMQTEDQLADDLAVFWCGLYTRNECQVALRINGHQLNEASTWLHTCGAYLREHMVVPTVSSVILAAKPKSDALDPVLLIAGTFYATRGQLCVVSPPGLYTIGDENTTTRAANSCDASWFFSLKTGALLADKPVLLKGIPAGSPTCVDMTRKRILVFSGYLNCIEEYVDHVQQDQHLEGVGAETHCDTLADTGRHIISQFARLMRKRAALPAYKHLRAGLQEVLFRTERESGSSDKQPKSQREDGVFGTKSKSRRIKNVRTRLKELDQIRAVDRPGHIIPFCVDFDDDGFLQLLQAIKHHCGLLSSERGRCNASIPAGTKALVASLLRILIETVQEFEFAGVTINIKASGDVTQQLFHDTERVLRNLAIHLFHGQIDEEDIASQRERSDIVLSAHFLLVWGIRKEIFGSGCRSEFLTSACDNIIARASQDEDGRQSPLPDSYFAFLLEPYDSLVLQTKLDCDVDVLRRLLYSPMDDGRIAIADFVPTEDEPFSRLLKVLFTLSKLESRSNSQRIRCVADDNGLPFQTPLSKALHSVMNYCCARMYATNAELLSATSPKEVGEEVLKATATFERFTRACFDWSLEMLQRCLRSDSEQVHDLRSSVVGMILPIVVAFIPNFPENFSDDFRTHLVVLMKTVDKFLCTREKLCATTTKKKYYDAAIFGGYQVVETPHPYNHTQVVFRRVVHIPGAIVLHFEFDPRCRTSGEADIVLITSGLAYYPADRLPYGDVGFGEDGGCFFGSYLRGNWPAGGLTVVGDTATVMLCATTQSRTGLGDKKWWGLKCTVRGLFDTQPKSWIYELGCGVANACSVVGDKLLRGLPTQSCEKMCEPWAMKRSLFNLAIFTCSTLKSGRWKFVDDVLSRTPRGDAFFSRLAKYLRLRSLPPRYSTARWAESLQEAAGVFLVCSDCRLLEAWFASVEKGEVLSEEDEHQLFHNIAVDLGKLERWMLRQVQLVSEWHYLRMDDVSLDELMERYAGNLDRLSEICQLKGVIFKKGDITGCVKSIHELIGKEIAAGPDKNLAAQPSGSHEAVAQAVSAKARFLLKRWQKCVETCNTYLETVCEPIRPRISESSSDVGKFLCSTVTVSALEECSAVHTSRLESRLAGVEFCKGALAELSNKGMFQFFVGRVLHSVPSSNLGHDDGIFSGCSLADPDLLAQMMFSLRSYSTTIGAISEAEDELSAFRVVALADCWDCAHSLNSIPSCVLGLERVSNLLVAVASGVNASSAALDPEAGDCIPSRSTNLRNENRHVYDTSWILLRLLTEEICESTVGTGTQETSQRVSMERVFSQFCVLYKYFAAKDKAEGQPWNDVSDEATFRLVCTMVNKVSILLQWTGHFQWWAQNAIDLVANSSSPSNLGVAGIRFIRFALDMVGDAIFDLGVVIGHSIGKRQDKDKKIVLGSDIQKILLRRVGNIVSPLASTVDSGTARDQCANHCVVIFRNEVATDKLVDATNKVGKPDIKSLKIPVAVDDVKNVAEKAVTEAVAECTAAQATIKHPRVRCDGCNQSPLRGFRFKCSACPKYDVCTTCYMNRTHYMDHSFVRLSDTDGTGDLLQARSKGGGVVPETALVGSKSWKGNLLRVLLDSQGYAVYCFGSRRECCDTASALAEFGLLVTVTHVDDMKNLDLLHDWESKVHFSFEPGSSRLSQRRPSNSSGKGTLNFKKAGRDVINAFNRKAAMINLKNRQSGREVEDKWAVASEIIAVLRLIVSSRRKMPRWRSKSLEVLTEVLEDAPRQLVTLKPTTYDAYFIALGATQVLGGYHELLRVGGSVLMSSYAADKAQGEHTGLVYSYAFGNDDVVIAKVDANPNVSRNEQVATVDRVSYCKCTSDEVQPISGVLLDEDTIQLLEPLVVPFCSMIREIYIWTSEDRKEAVDDDKSSASLLRWELACALMQSFSSMAPVWPSLFDNQVISTNGNAPAILFQLAQMCMRDRTMEDIADTRALLWRMEWLRARELHFFLATRPISSIALSACDEKTSVLRPSTQAPEKAPSLARNGTQTFPDPSDYYFNLYACSSRGDLPQHSGRNRMLEYWEKNVIPAIKTYVSGSFKSYEMDYFFAQLREPLREGNAAAALKIAYTLCDGHVPSGCHYPDPDTDWSALQIDDIEVGGRYVIASDNLDVADWPQNMVWTLGHSGAVRLVNPSGMVLLQVTNPVTAVSEYWWYHIDSLRLMSSVTSVSEQSVIDFESSRSRLKVMNQQLIYSIARKSVFDLLQVAPEHAMTLSIETRKTSLARTSSSPMSHVPKSTSQLAGPLPIDLENRYGLADLLRLAAAANFGYLEKKLSSEMSIDSTQGGATQSDDNVYFWPRVPSKAALITKLQTVLNNQFERAAASPPPPVMNKSTSYDENASFMVTMPTKKHKKRGKSSALAGKIAAASGGTSANSTAVSSITTSPSRKHISSLRFKQPKLQQPEVLSAFSTRKYRFLLLQALVVELKASLDLSSAFLRSRSFTVTSDSPPQTLVLVNVPDVTCLVFSFAVDPVLMDLPAGSCLEFFRDERCTDRLFGYFGDKHGLNYLPPLVVPGDRCYVRMSQGTHARYKFRVDAFTADFGLALWLCEEIYQKLVSLQLSHYEMETVLTKVLDALADYLIVTSDCLPSNGKSAVHKITGKLINFALSKGAMHSVPIRKSSGLVKELTFVHDKERTTQNGLYSLFTQQLAELISLVEEVSSLKGCSSSIVRGTWWKEFVRMAVFSRVLAQGKQEIATPNAFKRIYCGRAPIREIQSAHAALGSCDLFSERIIFLQNLPRTANVAELEASISRFLVHLALEECGEADDQNVYSAATVTRFGIISNVLYMPVDNEGQTKGYAFIDIGHADVISNLLTRVPKDTFEFDGGIPSEEDTVLLAKIEAVCRPPNGSSDDAGNGSGIHSGKGACPSKNVWTCEMCTLDNSLSDVECAACGSPVPHEMAHLAREVRAQSHAPSTAQSTNAAEDVVLKGWACESCTFVNSWADNTCNVCTMERSAELVPPAFVMRSEIEANSDQHQEDGVPSLTVADELDRVSYKLSAARFTEMVRVADETGEVPAQVAEFLLHRFFQKAPRVGSEGTLADGNVTGLTVGLRVILQRETAQYHSSSNCEASVETFAALTGVKVACRWNSLSAKERLSKLISSSALSKAEENPVAVYKWMLSSGYDLQFESSHYASVDDAMQAQESWTHQMDCQLIAVCRELCGTMGVLTLTELCPSHLSVKDVQEYSLLSSLETRDLRLRFAVLQSLNKLLISTLPLVNLRPWTDPSSLRSRIVSIRQLIFSDVKIRFFAQTQDNATIAHSAFVDTNVKRPMVTIDRRKIAGNRGSINVGEAAAPMTALHDPKSSLFASTMNQLSTISPSLLRAKRPKGASDPFVSFVVIFTGENVVGEGGPYRQLFNDISNELLADGNPLFVPTQNNVMKTGEFRERFMPKPSSTTKELLQMFEFVGILMACCLRTGVRLNLRLAPLVWKMLVKQSLVLADLDSVDHSLCESLKFLEELAAGESEDPDEVLYDSFTTTLSDGTVVELKTGGQHVPVTKRNVKEYIRLVKATRLQECKPQVDAMLRGLGKIVPVQLLQLCVWSELQQWVSGSLKIDIKLLKRHTRYTSGMSPENFPHLEMFWKVLAGFSEENKRRFINFAWGQDTLPVDDAEFDRSHMRLLIKAPPQNAGVNQDNLLPKADTCFFNIELPVYSSEEVMREKLLLAITLCTSLDGDDQTADHDIYYAGDDIDDDGME